MPARSLLALAACTACLPAAALLVRADRDDSEYLELATRYASSIRLPAPAGEAVLIAPRWLLTAAAPALLLKELKPTPPLTLADRTHEIQAIHVQDDLALVQLATPVRGIAPMAIYRANDEAGKGLAIVAHGPTGKIGGATRADGRRRAGLNTVAAVQEKTFEVRIHAGDEASDLQGALAPGEVGAGAYIVDADDRLFLAGIAQSTDGKRELYSRLSTRLAWIEAVMLEVAKREAEKLLGSPG
jgi:hypothetical protein